MYFRFCSVVRFVSCATIQRRIACLRHPYTTLWVPCQLIFTKKVKFVEKFFKTILDRGRGGLSKRISDEIRFLAFRKKPPYENKVSRFDDLTAEIALIVQKTHLNALKRNK